MSHEPSKKRSDKPSSSAPHSGTSFFIDRNLGRYAVVNGLRAAGFSAIALHEKFADQTPDEKWLASAGKHGWIVLSADKRIRFRPDEREAFVRNKVRAVFLTSGNLTTAQQVSLITRAASRILDTVLHTAPPAAFSLTKDGALKPLKL